MTTAPILRSSALQRALAAAPARRTTAASGDFASVLASAQTVKGPMQPARASAVPSSSSVPAVSGPVPFKDMIEGAARRNGVDPALLAGLIKQESNFNPNARSGAGAQGLTQLMPSTARGLGVSDPTDPSQSIEAGARLLGGFLKQFHGDEKLALAAYNAGPGAVQKYGGIPPYEETQRYVPKVLANATQFRRIWAN
jgi:soluble lytic murein transglycosylase-like protein